MSDPLDDRFAEFRSETLARTRPPGVAAVRRRVARRHATRAVVLVLVALGIAASAWLPGHYRSRGPVAAPPSVHVCPSAGDASTSKLLIGAYPDVLGLSAALMKGCPAVQLTLVRATYSGDGPTSTDLSLFMSYTRTLSVAVPTTTMAPGRTPPGTCRSYLIVTLVQGGPLPPTIPNPIPELAVTGSDASLAIFWSARGFSLVGSTWGKPVCR
jgi:hypothetical protein